MGSAAVDLVLGMEGQTQHSLLAAACDGVLVIQEEAVPDAAIVDDADAPRLLHDPQAVAAGVRHVHRRAETVRDELEIQLGRLAGR